MPSCNQEHARKRMASGFISKRNLIFKQEKQCLSEQKFHIKHAIKKHPATVPERKIAFLIIIKR